MTKTTASKSSKNKSTMPVKITPQDDDAKSANLVADNIQQLKTLFPEACAEGKIDFDVLRQLLGDTVDEREEKFGLNWHGKRRARQLALQPSMGTLRPCKADSVDWDTTKNLMIEGDNLEVLKLLQRSYAGKVKLIYIDPPYNTGNDFVYPDDFRDSIKNYLELTGQVEGGKKLSTNSESSGRFHTDWLNMMYPRLKLARELLREDGVISITLDDNEIANLRSICDDVFGSENFLATAIWQKKYAVANDDPGIGVMHDYVVIYQRSSSFSRSLLPRTKEQNDRYTNSDHDPKGPWASDNYVSNKSKDERPTLWYPIRHPETGAAVWPDEHAVWRYSEERHLELEAANSLYWGPNNSYKKPRLKRYLCDVQNGIVPATWWPFEEVGHNDEAQKETAALLGQKVFSTPKPLRLIERMLTIGLGSEKEAIVLDFFAGSGSTGHGVMQHTIANGTAARYVLVQLPEVLHESIGDQRAAYKLANELGVTPTIAELTKERLRRAAKKIKEENPMFAGDLGFRVFKLDSSNINTWDPATNDLEKTLYSAISNLKDDRTEEDLLFEVLLKLGLELTVPIETKKIGKLTLHSIGQGALIACLAPKLTAAVIEDVGQAIVAWHQALAPNVDSTVILRDSAFPDDVTKANLTAILQQYEPRSGRKLVVRSL